MKRFCLVAVALLAMLLSGCSGMSAAEPLSEGDEQLSYSIKSFFAAEDVGYADGDAFSAKLLRCTKVKFMNEKYAMESIYRYKLIIAPRYNRPMDKIQVKAFPTNGVADYVQSLAQKGAKVNAKQGFILEYPPMGIVEKNKLVAFEFDFYLSNFGDAAMEEFGISQEDMDKGMTELRVEVFCDGKTDVLNIYCLTPPDTVTSEDDEAAREDSMVKELVMTGASKTTFGVYQP